MTPLNRCRARHAAVAAALVLAAGCSSSDGAADPTSTPAPADAPAGTATAAEPDVESAPTPDPEAAAAGSGELSIVLGDGRTWTLDTEQCSFDPEATGPAAAVLNIAGENSDGVELDLLDAWPFDGTTENGTVFFGNFADETDEVFVLVNGSSTMVGSTVEVTADFYNNVFYEDGDTPDGTAVITCTP